MTVYYVCLPIDKERLIDIQTNKTELNDALDVEVNSD